MTSVTIGKAGPARVQAWALTCDVDLRLYWHYTLQGRYPRYFYKKKLAVIFLLRFSGSKTLPFLPLRHRPEPSWFLI